MPSAPPITDAERARIAELHAQGMTRNAISQAIGRSPAAVSKAAAQAGLSFDRSRVAAATAARQVDNRTRRAHIEAGLLEDVARLRARLFAPLTVVAFGGADFGPATWTLDEPDPRAQKDLMAAIGTAVTASLRIAEVDSDGGVTEGRSLLGGLMAELREAAAALDAP